jgi:acetolactate synthase-1/3 small subunit
MSDIVYSIVTEKELPERRVIGVLVDNEFGVLARVVDLFSGRGYNIDTLSVAEVDPERNLSRITITTTGTEKVIAQIKSLLDRMVPVHSVHDLSIEGPHVERGLALVKVAGTGQNRVEALRIADIFRAHTVDSTTHSFVFEIIGNHEKIDAFIDLMRPLGLIEVARTGVAAMARGSEAMQEGHRRVTELRQ